MEITLTDFLTKHLKIMLFITSDIKVLATLTFANGNKQTLTIEFNTAKRGLFKEEMERFILKNMNQSGITNKVIKVHVH